MFSDFLPLRHSKTRITPISATLSVRTSGVFAKSWPLLASSFVSTWLYPALMVTTAPRDWQATVIVRFDCFKTCDWSVVGMMTSHWLKLKTVNFLTSPAADISSLSTLSKDVHNKTFCPNPWLPPILLILNFYLWGDILSMDCKVWTCPKICLLYAFMSHWVESCHNIGQHSAVQS